MRFFRALLQFFGRKEGMHEVDRRAQFVRSIESEHRRRRVGHAQSDGVSLSERKLRGKVVRKGIDAVKHLGKGVFLP